MTGTGEEDKEQEGRQHAITSSPDKKPWYRSPTFWIVAGGGLLLIIAFILALIYLRHQKEYRLEQKRQFIATHLVTKYPNTDKQSVIDYIRKDKHFRGDGMMSYEHTDNVGGLAPDWIVNIQQRRQTSDFRESSYPPWSARRESMSSLPDVAAGSPYPPWSARRKSMSSLPDVAAGLSTDTGTHTQPRRHSAAGLESYHGTDGTIYDFRV